MTKYIGFIVLILAIVLLAIGSSYKKVREGRVTNPLSNLSFPGFEITNPENAITGARAWATWQNYLEFAKNHDLKGIRESSHQISDTCNDPSKETECFAMMDNVYAIGSELESSAFKYIQADEKQIILFTDRPVVTSLYFTRTEDGTPKLLGLRFCSEQEGDTPCIETDPEKKDLNDNGWWDSVESFFHTPV